MEELLQYVWLHRLWKPGALHTVDGEPLHVIDVGQHNRDAGPDFFNAKVRIGERLWCGNVEMHIRASDWYRHGHDKNPAYDTVVLHVVEHDDCRISRPDGEEIPQIELPCAADFTEQYNRFVANGSNELACAAEVATLPAVMVHDWLDSLAFERLYAKVDAITGRLERFVGHWEQAAFVTLARALGAGINGDAFERMAASLPLNLLHKHSDNLLSVEALLFGQAGLLPERPDHPYVEQLAREYEFLKLKFGLKPPQGQMWRMSRMRPQSFPHRRLAGLSMMIYGGFDLMSRMLATENEEQARALFDITLTGYWTNHFNFGAQQTAPHPTAFGRSTVDMLIINVVAPMLMAYGNEMGNESATTRAVDILEHLPPERNRLTGDFVRAGIACTNALTSQAMVELHRNYCEVRKCLYCRLGHRLLAAKAVRS